MSSDELLTRLREWALLGAHGVDPDAMETRLLDVLEGFEQLDRAATGGDLPVAWRPDPLDSAFYCPDCGNALDDWRGHRTDPPCPYDDDTDDVEGDGVTGRDGVCRDCSGTGFRYVHPPDVAGGNTRQRLEPCPHGPARV